MTNHTPTPEQSAIIRAVLDGESIIVNALAGAAKSSTLQMAAQALPPAKFINGTCIALAFNKKIKEDLAPKLPFLVNTINAFGQAIWFRQYGRLKVEANKLADIRKRVAPDTPWEVTRVVSAAKLAGLVPAGRQIMGRGILADTPENWAAIADEFDFQLDYEDPRTGKMVDLLPVCRKILETSIDLAFTQSIDFDDQVYMPTCFGGQFGEWDLVFVDEAQDLSPLNHLMLQKMKPCQLVVVGDPLQSIYAFRGADTESMPKLQEQFELKEYRLTTCFRCAQNIVEHAQRWAPEMRFPEWAHRGVVAYMPLIDWASGEGADTWSFHDLPDEITVLCRNNAPLIQLALKIYRTHKIAFINERAKTSMLSQLRKICDYKKDLKADTVVAKIQAWKIRKLDTEDPRKHERIIDEAEALFHCAEEVAGKKGTYAQIEDLIGDLFQSKDAKILFSTGHGSKGLEWDHVLHLDPWRLPSVYARTDEALQQEENIHYVISTRAKLGLWHARLDEYKEPA